MVCERGESSFFEPIPVMMATLSHAHTAMFRHSHCFASLVIVPRSDCLSAKMRVSLFSLRCSALLMILLFEECSSFSMWRIQPPPSTNSGTGTVHAVATAAAAWALHRRSRRRKSLLPMSLKQQQQQQEESAAVATRTSSSSSSSSSINTVPVVGGGVRVDVSLTEHRPSMGCTVEESLAEPGTVFVSSVKEGGPAAMSGVLPGDVIVGITGLFGTLEDVSGLGIDKVKALVASRSDTEPLNLKLVRNTAVMANHEAALTELCANPDTSDEEAEQCVLEYLQGGYYDDDNTDDSFVLCDEDNENECVLDDLHNLWAADLSPTIVQPLKVTPQSVSTTTATKPWSSRASPSGTFVRDPVTGVMRNIDS